MGITIDVIADTALGDNKEFDNGVLQDWLKLHPGALRTLSLRDMINKVLARATGTTIDVLMVFGHGAPGVQTVGGGYTGNAPDFTKIPGQAIRFSNGFLQDRELLGKLSGRFTEGGSLASPKGLVELHGCGVGLSSVGQGLVRMLADLWKVRVRAGLGMQVADEGDAFEGGYLEANPLGTVTEHKFASPPFILVPPFPTAPERPVIHTVGAVITKADWLSSLAGKHYGDVLLWPIIFDRNKDVIFTNPNVMRPGQKIVIPPLPAMSAQQREQVKARGRDWKSYNS